MTTHQIPDGYELLPAPFLRLHGAVEGMLWITKGASIECWSNYAEEIGFEKPEHQKVALTCGDYDFCAPTGTIAAATTPLPEPLCNCEAQHNIIPHEPSCSIHRRYRHVLPGELAKMPTKPEGLRKASRGKNDWHEVATWPLIQRFVDGVYDFAYALPLSPQPEKGKGGAQEVERQIWSELEPTKGGDAICAAPVTTREEVCRDSISAQCTRSTSNAAPKVQPLADAATHALTDEEIRIRIAEWMGAKWHWISDRSGIFLTFKEWDGELVKDNEDHDHCFIGHDIPEYTKSLDAIASAEARLMFSQRQRYYEALREVCSADLRKGKLGLFRIADIECCRATAPQRALALIQMIQEQQ